jgi:hypothetical protein
MRGQLPRDLYDICRKSFRNYSTGPIDECYLVFVLETCLGARREEISASTDYKLPPALSRHTSPALLVDRGLWC